MFRPEKPVAFEYSDADMIDFKITGRTNSLGNTTARYFEHDGQRFGFEDEQYVELLRFAESIQRTKQLRDLVSVKWVEDVILDWVQNRLSDQNYDDELSKYLTERCQQDVSEHEIWFPVANFSIEEDLPFGKVVFRTFTAEIIDRHVEDLQKEKARQLEAGCGEEIASRFDHAIFRKRQELQGLAASTLNVTAEPKRAFEVALRKSENALAAMSLYNVAATTMPEIVSYIALLGRENVEDLRHFEMENGRIIRETMQGVGEPILNWHLSNDEVALFESVHGFSLASGLLTIERRTAFQTTILDALLIYSLSTRQKSLADRLLYMMVAAESVLLKDSNESIQQNIGERMAFLLSNTVQKRQAIIRNLKAAYALRSDFVHHGNLISELNTDERETIRNFMFNVWTLFLELVKLTHKFNTKDELINHLEAKKLS